LSAFYLDILSHRIRIHDKVVGCREDAILGCDRCLRPVAEDFPEFAADVREPESSLR
jgi:hypothetical protein